MLKRGVIKKIVMFFIVLVFVLSVVSVSFAIDCPIGGQDSGNTVGVTLSTAQKNTESCPIKQLQEAVINRNYDPGKLKSYFRDHPGQLEKIASQLKEKTLIRLMNDIGLDNGPIQNIFFKEFSKRDSLFKAMLKANMRNKLRIFADFFRRLLGNGGSLIIDKNNPEAIDALKQALKDMGFKNVDDLSLPVGSKVTVKDGTLYVNDKADLTTNGKKVEATNFNYDEKNGVSHFGNANELSFGDNDFTNVNNAYLTGKDSAFVSSASSYSYSNKHPVKTLANLFYLQSKLDNAKNITVLNNTIIVQSADSVYIKRTDAKGFAYYVYLRDVKGLKLFSDGSFKADSADYISDDYNNLVIKNAKGINIDSLNNVFIDEADYFEARKTNKVENLTKLEFLPNNLKFKFDLISKTIKIASTNYTIKVNSSDKATIGNSVFRDIKNSEVLLKNNKIVRGNITSNINHNGFNIDNPFKFNVRNLDKNERVEWDSRKLPFAMSLFGNVKVGFVVLGCFRSYAPVGTFLTG